MSYLEFAKKHVKLSKLLENEEKIKTKAAEDFAAKHRVIVEDIINMRVRGELLIGMHRARSAAIAHYNNEKIPKDVIFEKSNAKGVEVEWIYVPGAYEKKLFFHLFGGGYMMGNLDTRKWSPYLYSRETNMRCLNV